MTGLLAGSSPQTEGISLVALGSYGRGDRCAGSDLDLLLLHGGVPGVAAIADGIWYPIWDAGFRLDHSVRTVKECMSVAASDLRAAVGLLDARLVSGDTDLFRRLVDGTRRLWEDRAHRWLPALAAAGAERHARMGEVAFLLEPELKESRGGLRDVQMLRAAIVARPALGPLDDAVTDGAAVLVRVRDALHRRTGRASDRLVLEEQDGVASELGYADADALMHAVSQAGRAIAWHGDQAWNATTRRRAGRTRSLSADVEMRSGYVTITRTPADAELVWRAGGHAAELSAPLAPFPPVDPGSGSWDEATRNALVGLLGWGHAAIPVVETLDHTGILTRLIPEWEEVRSRPQRNPYHRFTVDRHLWETAANAAALKRTVRRPDLLLIGAWLHDIGKGRPGRDHTDAGVEIVAQLATRLGFPSPDVTVLVAMVRHHLTLSDAATRRDIDDPVTVATVADAVGSVELLELLEALSEADGLATGPAAWSPWKAQLVADLSGRVRRRLEGETDDAPHPPPPGELRPGIEVGPTVRVVARDRPRLLADVAGALAASGLEVRAARALSVGDLASEEFEVAPALGEWPDPDRVRARIEAALEGTLPIEGLLAERRRSYRRYRVSGPVAPEVFFEEASGTTVVEVRAADSPGLLYRVASAIADLGLDVVQVRAASIGNEAVDAFYVRGAVAARHDDLRAAVQRAAGDPADD